MLTSNWILLGILIVTNIVGGVIKYRTRRRVLDLEGFVGVIKAREKKGNIIGGN